MINFIKPRKQMTLSEMRTDDAPYVSQFCKRLEVELVKCDTTWENGFKEPIYFFTDGLGYYTIKGIMNSLEKSRNPRPEDLEQQI